MRKSNCKFYYLLLCTIFSYPLAAQKMSTDYGKVTEDELRMSVYDKDSTASAVVLYESGNSYYRLLSDNFQLHTVFKNKIKILTQEGVEEANISLPYCLGSGYDTKIIDDLKAAVYNLVDGKIVKENLDKKFIFKEKINSQWSLLKFTLPNVRAGSIIEYSYVRKSGSYRDIPDWSFQRHIPVMKSEYRVTIPPYFRFNFERKGFEEVKIEKEQENESFTYEDGSSLIGYSDKITFTATDVPAVPDEPYVWSQEDYTTKIRFELAGIKQAGRDGKYTPITQTWRDVYVTLNKHLYFGECLKKGNLFAEATREIAQMPISDIEKIRKLKAFIQSKIQWNGNYEFWADDLSDAVKKKTGYNSQINFLFINALKDMGYSSFPVMLRLRENGRVLMGYATIDKLDTFIVGVILPGNETIYIDASDRYSDINMLNDNYLVESAKAYNAQETDIVNLLNLSQNSLPVVVSGTIGEEGLLKGNRSVRYRDQFMYDFKKNYYGSTTPEGYKERLQSQLNATISDVKIDGLDSLSAKEDIQFEKQLDKVGDHIYIDLIMMGGIYSNPFVEQVRKCPIELDYPQTKSLVFTYTIPQGYVVEELPKSEKVSLFGDAISVLYRTQAVGDKIVVKYKLEIKAVVLPQTEYEQIKQFYAFIVNKNKEKIVLKKNS